jgi:hypothetical protein
MGIMGPPLIVRLRDVGKPVEDFTEEHTISGDNYSDEVELLMYEWAQAHRGAQPNVEIIPIEGT